MVERITDPQGNRGSDGLLSHYVNAVNPDKFRDRPQVNDDTQKQIAQALQEIAKQDRKQIEAADIKVIEGESRVVDGEGNKVGE